MTTPLWEEGGEEEAIFCGQTVQKLSMKGGGHITGKARGRHISIGGRAQSAPIKRRGE